MHSFIRSAQYETNCRELIHQFKLQESALASLCGMTAKDFIARNQ
jgi:hypothetical protein